MTIAAYVHKTSLGKNKHPPLLPPTSASLLKEASWTHRMGPATCTYHFDVCQTRPNPRCRLPLAFRFSKSAQPHRKLAAANTRDESLPIENALSSAHRIQFLLEGRANPFAAYPTAVFRPFKNSSKQLRPHPTRSQTPLTRSINPRTLKLTILDGNRARTIFLHGGREKLPKQRFGLV